MKKLRTLLTIFIVVFISLSATKPEKVEPVFDTPYTDQAGYLEYWKGTLDGFVTTHGIPEEVILAKMWNETNGGLTGAGRYGALFGIKGKRKGKSIKGFDEREKGFTSKGKVEYRYYEHRWEAISDFCQFLKGENGYNSMYFERYVAWRQIYADMPDWYSWLLALQVHPNKAESKRAYASMGVEDGTTDAGYAKRKKHAERCIKWVLDVYYPYIKQPKLPDVIEEPVDSIEHLPRLAFAPLDEVC